MPSSADPPPGRTEHHSRGYTATLALGALGVVYGDIGTSPLYALRECLDPDLGIGPERANVLGVLSLIVWSLILVVSVKYLALVMRADNRGEGGILALLALALPRGAEASRGRDGALVAIGLFGAALLYGDGMITPAITVLSAVEGLKVVTPLFAPYVVPLAAAILVGLFLVQKRGTERLGRAFGPVMLVWFGSLGALGLAEALRTPEVFLAFSPHHAVRFIFTHGAVSFLVLGSVFLVVTGGEALYADMGHFGRRPVQVAWFTVALPGLLLNYFGQGALVLRDPAAVKNPFFLLAPDWAVLPLVALSTMAAVIASQALITGVFSLTRQAVQLGYLPRMRIRHTSEREVGQIYVPAANWMLLAACIGLVGGFRSSGNLAAAYGLSVTGTMAATTALFYFAARRRMGWTRLQAGIPVVVFLAIDLAFFGANALKIAEGGWFPLVVGAGLFTCMATWKRGRRILASRLEEAAVSVDELFSRLAAQSPARVDGTAVFMSSRSSGVPPALLQNLAHNRVLHRQVVFVTVDTMDVPFVPDPERSERRALGPGIDRVVLRYGFMEDPDVPAALGPGAGAAEASYFLGGETLIPTDRPGMALWREHLFAFMSRLARPATLFFALPPGRVVEMSSHVEL